MGLMLDLVPNHMGVLKADNALVARRAGARAGIAIRGLLRHRLGACDEELAGKVLVPILGDQYGTVLERGEIALRFEPDAGELSLWYYEHRLPVRPAEYPRVLLSGVDRLRATSLTPHRGRASARRGRVRRRAARFGRARRRPRCGGGRHWKPRRRWPNCARACRRGALHRRERARRSTASRGEPASFDALHELIEGQAYRLAFWRVAADDINYRRFFDINDLAALRAEREDVFDGDASARARARLRRARPIACASTIPTALLDPARYFERLQAAACDALGGNAPDRRARARSLRRGREDPRRARAAAGHVAGARRHGLPLHERGERAVRRSAARTRFDRLYAAFIGEHIDFDDVLRRSKTQIIVHALASDLNRLATALTRIAKRDRRTRDFTCNAIRRALVEVVACFPVYRTYATSDARAAEDDATSTGPSPSPSARHRRRDQRLRFHRATSARRIASRPIGLRQQRQRIRRSASSSSPRPRWPRAWRTRRSTSSTGSCR